MAEPAPFRPSDAPVVRPPDGPGAPEPLGLTLVAGRAGEGAATGEGGWIGANVAVFSAHAERIELCLFDPPEGDAREPGAPLREVARIPLVEKTGDVFHGFVAGLAPGQRYGLRAYGPFDPARGHRFNPAKLLLEPHATRLDGPFRPHPSQFGHRVGDPDADLTADAVESADFVPKAVLEAPFDPGPIARSRVPWGETVVYECSVRGLTALHPDVPEPIRGTFAGLGHPAAVGYLKRLGVTTVELLPAMAWIDERHLPALGLANAWGYNPVAFCAPDPRLAPGGWAEVRAAVAALQAEGIEVVLDVVLNHGGESDELGPTLSLRGLDNASYLRLRPDDPRFNVNDTGCGNTLALDHPAMLRLALDALRIWATRAGLDGFRFDLAATLGRRAEGFDPAAPFLAALAQDPVLRDLKLIAEPWDIGPGGWQTGRFPAAWGEWNDRFRDDVRRFWRGDQGMLGAFATRFAGSEDLFAAKRHPSRSVNFVTAHDGFTLADLVSFAGKHNEANGEDNRDGTGENLSWNHGVEGATDDPRIRAARLADQKALIATLLVARGTPMLAMGAEAGRTQGGNNNAYAQDNRLNWLDHAAIDADLLAFTRAAIALRRAHPALRADRFLTGEPDVSGFTDVAWLDANAEQLSPAGWNDPGADLLIAVLAAPTGAATALSAEAIAMPAAAEVPVDRVAVVVHRGWHDRSIALPPPRPGHVWARALDSAATALTVEPVEADRDVPIVPRSVVVFVETPLGPERRRAPAAGGDLDRLARAAGIAPDWWDEMGGHHPVSDDTKRALLAAMGLDAGTAGAAADALARLADDGPFRPLPRTVVARADAPVRIDVPARAAGDRVDLVLESPGEPPRTLSLATRDAPRRRFEAPDGRVGVAVTLDLGPLAPGLHRLRAANRPEIDCTVVVAPPRMAQVPSLRAGARVFGIGAHLYAVRRSGDQGIGDFTTLGRLAVAAAGHGAATVGLNPLHALFSGDRDRASPYHPSDRRFLDPIYLDLAALGDADPDGAAAAVLATDAVAISDLAGLRAIDYPAVWRVKERALRAAFAGFARLLRERPDQPAVRDFAAFCAAGGASLGRFAEFEALARAHAGPWPTWDLPARTAAVLGGEAAAGVDAGEASFALYLQWLADRQLGAAADAARAAGLDLGFYRDLAVGAAPDGAETWADPDAFALAASIGAPPDRFSAEGQVWNLPPPNPLAEIATAGAGFAELTAANMRHAGLLRIDHVMGLKRLFWVPAGAEGRDGAYVARPFGLMMARLALESAASGVAVVGEDLGTVPDGFRERMDAADVLSYRVLWFEREGEGFRPPTRWPARAAACVSTHDLPTLTGWWQGADIDERRALGLDPAETAADRHLARQAEKRLLVGDLVAAGHLAAAPDLDAPLDDRTAAAIHAFVAAAPSCLMLAQIDDLAGEAEAVNLPGTDRERPNWRRRLAPGLETVFETPRAAAILAALRARR